MSTYAYGTVLKIQREDTLDEIKRNLEQISETGLTHVVVWPAVYWWENRSNSAYPYLTGMSILDEAERLGLQVVMELAGQITCLEYAPDFAMTEELLVKDRLGHPVEFDWSYYPINFNHPTVKRMTHDAFGDAARVYRDYPALSAYDIWNETMFTSYDEFTLELFRQWLRDKYGSIEKLNDSWDRVYRDWSQVRFTEWHWASVMPYVDHQEFRKDNIGLILDEWRSAVRAVDDKHPVLADNVGSMIVNGQWGYARPQDDWNIAANVDQVGFSVYPKPSVVDPPHRRWQAVSGMASATPDRRFWVAELQTHFATMHIPESRVEPWEIDAWTWEAVAHGARGVIHWKWRPFAKGYQTHGRGLVNTRGELSKRAEVVRGNATLFRNHQDLFSEARSVMPPVAILYDRLAHTFSKAYVERVPLELNERYTDSLAGLYKTLWGKQIAATYFTPEQVLNGALHETRLLIVSNQINVDEDLAAALTDFVRSGGTLLVDGKLGTVNGVGILHRDLPGPGTLNKLMGYWVEDLDAYHQAFSLSLDGAQTASLMPAVERQLISVRADNVEIIGRYADGEPAVLHRRLGSGEVFAITTCLWLAEHEESTNGAGEFVDWLAERLRLRRYWSDDPRIHLAAIESDAGLVIAAFNYHDAMCATTVHLRAEIVGAHSIRVEDLRAGKSIEHESGESVHFAADIPGRSVSVFGVVRQ